MQVQVTTERKNRLIKFEHPSNNSFAWITSLGTKGQKLPELQLALELCFKLSLTEVMPEGSSLPSKGRAEKLPSAASDNYIWPYIMKTMPTYSEALCTTLAIMYNSAVQWISNYELQEL